MANKIFLSVVIPSYNETENLRRGVLSEVRDYLAKQKYSWEVIVSDDDSPDAESKRLAREFCQKNSGFRFLENKHGGKPWAVWEGVQKAGGKLVLFTDMDQSTPIEETGKLLSHFERGYDVVIGSRGLERRNFSLFRKIASTLFRTLRRVFLLREIVDTQAGFKCLRTAVAREIFPVLEIIQAGRGGVRGWTVTSFDVELLVIAQMRGCKIAEVPVVWEDRDISVAKATERAGGKFIKESIDMAKEIFRVKLNQLHGYYNK